MPKIICVGGWGQLGLDSNPDRLGNLKKKLEGCVGKGKKGWTMGVVIQGGSRLPGPDGYNRLAIIYAGASKIRLDTGQKVSS